MMGSAYKLEKIESGTILEKNGVPPIHALHVTITNTSPVKITTLDGSSVEFPPNCFVRGVVYHIFVKKIEWPGESAGFIGYRLKSSSWIV